MYLLGFLYRSSRGGSLRHFVALELEKAHLPATIAGETLSGLVRAFVRVWTTDLL